MLCNSQFRSQIKSTPRSSIRVFFPKEHSVFIAPSNLESPSLEYLTLMPSSSNFFAMYFQRLITSLAVYELLVPKAPKTNVGLPEYLKNKIKRNRKIKINIVIVFS